ncbi:MAG: hypothetical protein M1821_003989 [Bathelium mastoideum]|nr:MAG: hypothetical protein M1821_003989 [Bathelium mastoideum]KAI9691061.1 MAG: hypothetical protein M1822_008681 [Bathelium mastoideum]
MDYLSSIGCPLVESGPKNDSEPRYIGTPLGGLSNSSRPSSSSSLLGQRRSTSFDFQSGLQNNELQTAAQGHLHSSVFPAHQYEPASASIGKGIGHPFEMSADGMSHSQRFVSSDDLSRVRNNMPPPRLSRSAGRIDLPARVSAAPNQEQKSVSRYFGYRNEQSQRPATAPLEHPVDYISQELPPRRELPFKSSSSGRSIGSSGKDRESRSSSTALELPPLPQPRVLDDSRVASQNAAAKTVGKQGRKPARGRGGSRGSSNAVGSRSGAEPDWVPSSSSVFGRSSSPSLPTTSLVGKTTYPSDSRGDDIGRSSDRDWGVEGVQSMSHEATAPQKTAPNVSRSAASINEDEAGLKAYASQNGEDRMDALESMICDLINNDDFLKLSEDVEACWRRIGLER